MLDLSSGGVSYQEADRGCTLSSLEAEEHSVELTMRPDAYQGNGALGGETIETTVLLKGELAGLACQESFQERRRYMAFLKIRIVEDSPVKRDGSLDTLNDKFA